MMPYPMSVTATSMWSCMCRADSARRPPLSIDSHPLRIKLPNTMVSCTSSTNAFGKLTGKSPTSHTFSGHESLGTDLLRPSRIDIRSSWGNGIRTNSDRAEITLLGIAPCCSMR